MKPHKCFGFLYVMWSSYIVLYVGRQVKAMTFQSLESCTKSLKTFFFFYYARGKQNIFDYLWTRQRGLGSLNPTSQVRVKTRIKIKQKFEITS